MNRDKLLVIIIIGLVIGLFSIRALIPIPTNTQTQTQTQTSTIPCNTQIIEKQFFPSNNSVNEITTKLNC